MLIADDVAGAYDSKMIASNYRANSITASERRKDETSANASRVPPGSSGGAAIALNQEEIESSYGLTNIQSTNKPL